MKSKSTIFVLLIVLGVLIGVVGGFFVSKAISEGRIKDLEGKAKAYDMFFGGEGVVSSAQSTASPSALTTKNTTVNNVTNTVTTTTSKENRFQMHNGRNEFEVNINGLKVGDTIEEYVTPDMKIKITIKNIESYGPEWSISVNGNEPAYSETSIGIAGERLVFYYTNKYILYETCDGTDIRSSKLIAIDTNGKLVKEIYEFDQDNKGLVLRDVEFGYNALIVKASRFGHGDTLYADKYYKATPIDFSAEALEKVPGNTVVSAVYVYKVNSDGSIDFNNPQVVNTQTFKEYVENYLWNATDETELTTKMHEFLEKNK